MSRLIKVLAVVGVMMALTSCTEAQFDCMLGNNAGCVAAGLGY